MASRGDKWLFIFVFFAIMLFNSREMPWNDGKQLHQVAEGIAERGEFSVAVGQPGKDGKRYAAHPFLVSAIHVPGALLHRGLMSVWPERATISRAMTCHLGPALLGALTAVTFLRLLLWLGISGFAAGLSTLCLMFATTVWVYARSPWSEITQTAAFTGFFANVLYASESPTRRRGLWLGLWAGLLLNSKLVYLPSVLGGAAFLGFTLRTRRHELGRLLAWAAVPGLVCVGWLAFYNQLRWGSVVHSGYSLPAQTFQGSVLFGLWGIFLSPGKSLFLYAPPLVLAVVGLAHPFPRRARLLGLMAVAVAPVLLVYARFNHWHGDWAWGPRYAVFAIPVMLVPAAFLLDRIWRNRQRTALVAAGALMVAGFGVQVLGSAFYWDHFIRVAQDANPSWLGKPNRAGASVPDRGGACDPCFEDLYTLNWLPPYQPIAGHFWLLKHVIKGDPWTVAQADPPWRQTTSLKLPLAASYPRARIDWWFLDFAPQLLKAGLALLGLFAGASIVAATMWIRAMRAPKGRPTGA